MPARPRGSRPHWRSRGVPTLPPLVFGGQSSTISGSPAGLAQLVERLTCNHEVASSILAPGSIQVPVNFWRAGRDIVTPELEGERVADGGPWPRNCPAERPSVCRTVANPTRSRRLAMPSVIVRFDCQCLVGGVDHHGEPGEEAFVADDPTGERPGMARPDGHLPREIADGEGDGCRQGVNGGRSRSRPRCSGRTG
jgi:hypothetical protein